MDTNWKSNRRISFLVAGLVVLIATVIYMAMIPSFNKQALQYDRELLQSWETLEKFYQANVVLYQDLQELIQGRELSFADLYLEVEEKEYYVPNIEYVGISRSNFTLLASAMINDLMLEWQELARNGILADVDYYMVDHETGKVISNVGKNLALLGTGEASTELQEYYPYYIKLTYGDGGILEKAAVKNINAEEFLTMTQNVMKERFLRDRFWERIGYNGYFGADDTIYYVKNDQYYCATSKIMNGPENVTVCYAISNAGMNAIYRAHQGNGYAPDNRYEWEQWMAYYRTDAGKVLQILLAVVGVIALLLCSSKRYNLHLLKGVKVKLEFVIAAMILLVLWTKGAIVSVLNYTQRGYFSLFYRTYLSWLPGNFWNSFLKTGIHAVVLCFFFAIWYFLVTAIGEVFSLGIKEYLQKRSLLVSAGRKISTLGKKKIVQFKEEISHINLSEENERTLLKVVLIHGGILAVLCLLWVFGWIGLLLYLIVLYFGLKKYIGGIRKQYGEVLSVMQSVAKGNLDTEPEGDWGLFENCKEELRTIRSGFKKAVEEEVKSQRMKTELITNVSHHLKTPLTAMTTYIELLDEEEITSEQKREYVGVLKKKAERLKVLIEDLFEISKASSGNVTMNLVDVDICNLIRQVYLEYEDKVEEAGLQFRFRLPEEKVILQLDSQKTCRVFENLYMNIIKYAMPGSRVYIQGEKTKTGICIELKNMSATELNISPKELTERFVRGDSSRNTEGSGLGLAIARSFVELQGGSFRVEIDGDLFKVLINW